MNFFEKIQIKIGESVSWLILAMALLTFLVVVLRYLFNTGFVWLQELVIYLHATAFLLTSGYALLKNGHVRVDIFYAGRSKVAQARVDILGTLLLLLPTIALVLYNSWPYVVDSWSVWERSRDSEGLPGVFLLKSLILLFAGLLLMAGISLVVRNIKVLKRGDNG